MCFILVVFQVHQRYPLIIAANRDERRTRPSSPPRRWPGEPPLWMGRDEVAGGTWLGLNERGLAVGITNRRDGDADPSRPSRGQLCLDALRTSSPMEARRVLDAALASNPQNPFNLLCASTAAGWVATWRGESQTLTPGVHVLTNHGDLDDESLPQTKRALAYCDRLDLARAPLEDVLVALGQLCADTSGPEPICRVGGDYGTVSSSLIALEATGSLAAYWHAEGPPSSSAYVPVLSE